MQVEFKQWICNIEFGKYSNGRTAIRLVDTQDGSLVMTASVNLPYVELNNDEICIKNYLENSGILQVLVQAGIVKPLQRYVDSGFVKIPICKLLK